MFSLFSYCVEAKASLQFSASGIPLVKTAYETCKLAILNCSSVGIAAVLDPPSVFS